MAVISCSADVVANQLENVQESLCQLGLTMFGTKGAFSVYLNSPVVVPTSQVVIQTTGLEDGTNVIIWLSNRSFLVKTLDSSGLPKLPSTISIVVQTGPN